MYTDIASRRGRLWPHARTLAPAGRSVNSHDGSARGCHRLADQLDEARQRSSERQGEAQGGERVTARPAVGYDRHPGAEVRPLTGETKPPHDRPRPARKGKG